MINTKDIKIAVIGLGYVGLPLSVEFGKKYPPSAMIQIIQKLTIKSRK